MSYSYGTSLFPWLIRFGEVAFVLMGGLLLGTQAQAEVIYTEDFGTHDGSGSGLPLVGWKAGYGTTSVEMSIASASGVTYGYTRANQGNALTWTTEPGDISTQLLRSISFLLRSDSGVLVRPAVQIGGDWFATSSSFLSSSSSTWNGPYTFDWTMDNTAWQDLNFSPGVAGSNTTLSLGSVLLSDLPSGDVTAFGLFINDYGGTSLRTSRFTTFQVSVVPEPSSLALLLALGGTMAVLASLRRRRRA